MTTAKELALTKGLTALVDNDVYEWAKNFKWCANHGYASRSILVNGKCVTVFLHQAVVGRPLDKGKDIDHINGNRADNRRENLRFVTFRENSHNREPYRRGKLVGCSYIIRKVKGKNTKLHSAWVAAMRVNGRNKHIGSFKTELEAHEAYMKAIRQPTEGTK